MQRRRKYLRPANRRVFFRLLLGKLFQKLLKQFSSESSVAQHNRISLSTSFSCESPVFPGFQALTKLVYCWTLVLLCPKGLLWLLVGLHRACCATALPKTCYVSIFSGKKCDQCAAGAIQMGSIPTEVGVRHFRGKKPGESGKMPLVMRPPLYFYGIAVVKNSVIRISLAKKKAPRKGLNDSCAVASQRGSPGGSRGSSFPTHR